MKDHLNTFIYHFVSLLLWDNGPPGEGTAHTIHSSAHNASQKPCLCNLFAFVVPNATAMSISCPSLYYCSCLLFRFPLCIACKQQQQTWKCFNFSRGKPGYPLGHSAPIQFSISLVSPSLPLRYFLHPGLRSRLAIATLGRLFLSGGSVLSLIFSVLLFPYLIQQKN